MKRQRTIFDEELAYDIETKRHGDANRDHAVARVEKHADDQWKVSAYCALLRLAKSQPQFTSDDVWTLLRSLQTAESTHDNRAMGPIFLQARRNQVIEPTNEFVKCQRGSRNSAPIRVWRSLVFGQGGERVN